MERAQRMRESLYLLNGLAQDGFVSRLPSFVEQKIRTSLEPDRVAKAIAGNEKENKLRLDELQVDKIVHLYFSNTGQEFDGESWWMVHYRVTKRKDDEKNQTVGVELKRVHEPCVELESGFRLKPETTITLSWDKKRPVSYLSASPLEWVFVSGIPKGSHVRFWPFLHVSRLCDGTTCNGQDATHVFDSYM